MLLTIFNGGPPTWQWRRSWGGIKHSCSIPREIDFTNLGTGTDELSGFTHCYMLIYMLHMFYLYVEVLLYIYHMEETRKRGGGEENQK